MQKLCARAAQEQLPIFLFGGSEAQLAALSERLTARFPGLVIAGTRPSEFRKVSEGERPTRRRLQ